MDSDSIRLLLVEDNPGDVLLFQTALEVVHDVQFTLTCCVLVEDALQLIGKEIFDVILLDLSLPDSAGLNTYMMVRDATLDIPVIVLTGLNDNTVALEAVQMGAQDYLVKGTISGVLLARSIRYAIERQRMLLALRKLSLIDELTGLYNRRGFLTLAVQQARLSLRLNKGLMLFYADMDGLKFINDCFGHQEGDTALLVAAQLLKETFRESDLVARIGGDEFAALVLGNYADKVDIIQHRLDDKLAQRNMRGDLRYRLGISIGASWTREKEPVDVEALISQADARMYEVKLARKR